jgi:hypothetical protein
MLLQGDPEFAPWVALLGPIYGAVDEEVLLPLGVMTVLAWAYGDWAVGAPGWWTR